MIRFSVLRAALTPILQSSLPVLDFVHRAPRRPARRILRVRAVALPAVTALTAAAFAACGGDTRSPAQAGPVGPGPGGGLVARFAVDPPAPGTGGDFAAALLYALPSGRGPLGAYAVEIRFDPTAVRFVAADPGMSQGRVVNALEAPSGSIVIAGASGTGFTDGFLFKGTFRALASTVTPADFGVTLREAADTHLADLVR